VIRFELMTLRLQDVGSSKHRSVVRNALPIWSHHPFLFGKFAEADGLTSTALIASQHVVDFQKWRVRFMRRCPDGKVWFQCVICRGEHLCIISRRSYTWGLGSLII